MTVGASCCRQRGLKHQNNVDKYILNSHHIQPALGPRLYHAHHMATMSQLACLGQTHTSSCRAHGVAPGPLFAYAFALGPQRAHCVAPSPWFAYAVAPGHSRVAPGDPTKPLETVAALVGACGTSGPGDTCV
jgi:hypothetical protein